MSNRLSGKVAIVTGAAGGIGKSIAQEFVAEGASVIVADTKIKFGKATIRDTKRKYKGCNVEFLQSNVSQLSDIKKLVDFSITKFGKIDLIVNNAAWTEEASAVELSESKWDKTLDVSLKSVYLMAKFAIPKMKNGGSIINISSVNGIVTNPGFAAYSAAKAGMLGLTRNLALEYAHNSIRVNAICPGMIATEAFLKLINKYPQEKWGAKEVQPLPYWGRPEDVARTAIFLASDDSRFMTGATLVLDGGLTIQSAEAIVRPWFRKRWRQGKVELKR
ncbi:MAG: SDR family oxidoreductase [Pirellulales bacterium]